MSKIQLQTNLKVIKSGNTPNSTQLPEGNLAFGVVGGEPKLYGNDGSGVKEYGADSGSTTVIDNLNSTDTTAALSANQGRILNNKIGDIDTALDLINGEVV